MPDKSFISIITVVYNRHSEIEETIKSVLDQTVAGLEYIIVDGASTDGTIDIIKKYSDRITKWISEPDKGIYDAMNKGLRLCSGEWVYFMNAGDSFLNGHVLSDILSSLNESKYSVVAGKVQATDGRHMQLFPVDARIKDLSARSLFFSSFCHQALFVKRKAYLHHGAYNLDYKTFADFDVVHKIIGEEKGYAKTDVLIALYDLGGVSNNWRHSMRHFRERERIFEAHGDAASAVGYGARYIKSLLFFYRKKIGNFFKR